MAIIMALMEVYYSMFISTRKALTARDNLVFPRITLMLFIVFFLPQIAFSEPYLAVQSNQPCSACHINPTGGAARNSFGNHFGTHVLPQKGGSNELFDPGVLSETIRLGADLRANFNANRPDEGEDTRGFETQSAQLYFHLQPKDTQFSLYIDQQVAPGAAINREAFLLFNFSDQHYLKAGRFFMPYGLRLEDDSAFVRQATQFNFDNSDNGVELSLKFFDNQLLINTAISNGSSGTSNEGDQLQYLVRAEWHSGIWRVGANTALNQSNSGDRITSGAYSGINIGGWIFLGEINLIQDESITNVFGQDSEQLISLIEMNKLLIKGLNLKLSYEHWDPDTDISNNDRSRSSALLEYTPFANLQVRGGLRIGDDIPQRNTGNFTEGFVQAHVYF